MLQDVMSRMSPYQAPSYSDFAYHQAGPVAAAPESPALSGPAGGDAAFAPGPDSAANTGATGQPYIPFQYDPIAMAVRNHIQYDDDATQRKLPGTEKLPGSPDAEPCRTCSERAYLDGSNDSSVSFQTPTHIDPGQSASAVRSHEREHVFREKAHAQQNGREVVSQSVSIHTAVCPECGRPYVSGGTTCTTTREETKPAAPEAQAARQPEQA